MPPKLSNFGDLSPVPRSVRWNAAQGQMKVCVVRTFCLRAKASADRIHRLGARDDG